MYFVKRIEEILEEAKNNRVITKYSIEPQSRAPFNLLIVYIKFDPRKTVLIFGEDHEHIRRFSKEQRISFWDARQFVLQYVLEKLTQKYDGLQTSKRAIIFEAGNLSSKRLRDLYRTFNSWRFYIINYRNHFNSTFYKNLEKYFFENEVVVIYVGKNHVKEVVEKLVCDIGSSYLFKDLKKSSYKRKF